MTPMMYLHAAAGRGAFATAVSALTGEAVGGLALGIFMALLTIIGIVLTALGMARKNARDYDSEIVAAETRGELRAEKRLQPWVDYWKDRAEGQRWAPPPTPEDEP